MLRVRLGKADATRLSMARYANDFNNFDPIIQIIMSFFRPLVSLMLVLISVLVVSCSDGSQAKAPTYSTQQLAQIQATNKNVVALSNRLPELAALIQERDWNNVKSFIHGPLGEIRTRMSGLSRELLPGSKEQALACAIAASATAASSSATDANATRACTSPVAGLNTSAN